MSGLWASKRVQMFFSCSDWSLHINYTLCRTMISKICIEQRIHIFTGLDRRRSVLEESVPEAYSLCLRPTASNGTQTEGTVSLNYTDWPRPVNNIFIFFLLRFSLTFQPLCVEVGCVRVDEVRDHVNQNKTPCATWFLAVIYVMALTALL